MRLSRNLIEKIIFKIISDLRTVHGIKILKKENELTEIIKDAIISDLKIEDEIIKEAEVMLKKHSSAVAKTGLDNYKALEAIKVQVAKERNYIIK